MNAKILAGLALAAFLLGGCAAPIGSAQYRGYEAMGEQNVRYGVVETVRDVNIALPESGVGAASGSMLGMIGGSYAGHSPGASFAGAIAGALIGGLLGQQMERSANERPGVELTVLLDSGKHIAVVQDGEERFRAGDRVRVLTGHRGFTRVTH